MPKGSIVHVLACPLAALVVTAGSVGAGAQEPTDAPERGSGSVTVQQLDRVVVTARRRDEVLRDVPQAITAITGDELVSRGASDISALDMVTPNLTIFPARAFNGSVTAYIRGIGQNDPIWGVEPGVGVYLDDVQLARPQGALLDVLDVERVEVLRGPQGTLYGRNSLGGAIKVVTRAPEAEFGGKVALTVGNYNRRDAKLVLNLPLSDDVRTRFAAASYDRDGYGRNLFNGSQVSARDAAVARFSALWTPNADLEVRFAWDRYRDRSGAQGARRLAVPRPAIDPDQIPLDPGRHDTRSDVHERLDLDNEGASLTADWAFRPRWRLRSISAWRHGDSQAVLDMDSLPQPQWRLGRDFAERQRSQEFQLHHDGDDARLVAGLYLFEGIDSGDGRSDARHFTPPPHYRASGSIRTRSAAAYADWVRDLAPAWQLELGLRYTVEHKRVVADNGSYTDASYTTRYSTSADFTDSTRYREPTPRMALSWRASEATMLYAQVSRGFKGGSYNVRANVVEHPESAHPLDAETVLAWEIGAKGDWLDGRLGWAAAAFLNDYRDIQLTVLTLGPGSLSGFPDFRNAGSGTTRGAELEWQARLGPVLRWSGHVGYLDTRYDEFIHGGVDVSGSRRFPNAPRWTAGAALAAEVPLRGAGALLARIGGRYQSQVQPNVGFNALLHQGGYSVWNASLAWTSPDRRWELAARMENLGDTAYRTSGFAYAEIGIVTGYYGPPRTYSLTLARSF